MRPDALTAAMLYVPGSGPVALELISAGEVNETWRVARAGIDYALRLATPAAPDLGLDRHWECRVLEAVAAAGLAPALGCCAPQTGVLVMRWAQGVRFTPEEPRGLAHLERIAHLVRRIQACPLPMPAPRMSPDDWILHYAERLDAAGEPVRRHPLVSAQARNLDARRAALARLPPAQAVLCHGDLHRDNLIDGPGGLVLIDWEYAHLADPLWDLAGWSSNNDLAPAQDRQLLEAYLGAPPPAEAELRLVILRWFYEYLCLLWRVLTGAGGSVRET